MNRILIVEDEILIAYSMQKKLEGEFESEIATNYEEAKMLLTHKYFDMVLIDIMLSGNKTGFDLAEFINQNLFLPIIFTTALTDAETLKKVHASKPSAYLSKPVDDINLITAIHLALGDEKRLKISLGKKTYYIQTRDFLFAEADHIYVKLFFNSGKNQLVRTSLTHLQKVLPETYFQRINRKIAVNPSQITETNHDKITVGEQTFKVSKNFRSF